MDTPATPALLTFRVSGHARAAVVFVHGFTGDASATWGQFPLLIQGVGALDGWDVYSLGYPSTLRVDVPSLWSADPPLRTVALSVATALRVAPLAGYDALALVGHSMGGLVVQQILLDRSIGTRIGHVALFGTPSNGLYKAILGLPAKRQLRDMVPWSPFILQLRWRWRTRFGKKRPFEMRVIAGERDEFVPIRSCHGPFEAHLRRVVPGDHVSMVKPVDQTDRSIQVLVELLTNQGSGPSLVDSALLAIERRDFYGVVESLEPRVETLDESGLTALALALDGVGRTADALTILETHLVSGTASTDARGILAGRLKRRWLAGRDRDDLRRARELYSGALAESAPDGDSGPADHDQAMYHAINIAFLDLMSSPEGSAVPQRVRSMAERAKAYAARALEGHWRSAVLGDAAAMLGDLDAASRHYVAARTRGARPRELGSIYAQAIRIAARVFGQVGAERIEECFRLAPPTTTRSDAPE